MAIGKAIGGYLLVGLLCVPFVYSNNANGYRSDGTARNVGQALSGGLLFWPSYLFSIEPEIDGDSVEDFGNSFRDMLEYRNTKWFAGGSDSGRRSENRRMMEKSLAACVLAFDTDKRIIDEKGAWGSVQSGTEPYYKALEKKVMDHFDDEDFAGFVAKGLKCVKKL